MNPDSSKPFKAVLFGVGGYGGVHLQQLRALESQSRLRLVALADEHALHLAPHSSGHLFLSDAGNRHTSNF